MKKGNLTEEEAYSIVAQEFSHVITLNVYSGSDLALLAWTNDWWLALGSRADDPSRVARRDVGTRRHDGWWYGYEFVVLFSSLSCSFFLKFNFFFLSLPYYNSCYIHLHIHFNWTYAYSLRTRSSCRRNAWKFKVGCSTEHKNREN